MTKGLKPLLWASLIGLVGVLIHLSPWGLILEEKFGLAALFQSRGTIPAPDEVVVIAIDQPSATQLDLPLTPRLWPRGLHAQLIDKLAQAGARLIVFDLIFDMPSVPDQDEKLAQAIQKAGNVVLVERLVYRARDWTKDESSTQSGLEQEGPAPLWPMFAEVAMAQAPFPLPKTERVNDYWTFKASAGDMPTTPVLILHILAQPFYADLWQLLHRVDPQLAKNIPATVAEADLEDTIYSLRQVFVTHPHVASQMQRELQRDRQGDATKKRLLSALLNLYSGADKHYLNFYGPPRSIRTIPFHQAVQPITSDEFHPNDFRDKVVFIGFSGSSQPEQDIVRDDYHTVFSNPDGLYISGVEIQATAFANLLENRTVKLMDGGTAAAILFVFGWMAMMVFQSMPSRYALLSATTLFTIYFLGAHFLFSSVALWVPVVIPLLQLSLALALAEALKHYLEKRKSEELSAQLVAVRQSLGSFYPDAQVERLLSSHDEQGIYSPCLTTDVAGYTTLAEFTSARELGELMRAYRIVLRDPIKQHQGHIMDMVADSMLAIWIGHPDHGALRFQACRAALDLAEAVEQFNQSQPDSRMWLPTRIGLHCGEMSLRRGDGSYNVIGDVVNTANRIQGANKVLHTRILMSKEVIEGLDGFLTRSFGSFLLPGKTIPVQLIELLACHQSASPEQLWLCRTFERALHAYQARHWVQARQDFAEILQAFPGDGPSQFFMKLCLNDPPAGNWNPVSHISTK